jgi:flagellar protein FliO/FliZ
MSGQWGSTILQFVITFAVVVVLAAVVYWLVRRYSNGGLGRIGRGRVPRLAVIDAVAVDGRRRLILVRRDNVEHLILVGGPSDVVVEQAILRPRQRPVARPQAAPQPAPVAAVTVEAPVPGPESQPIPFPQPHVAQNGGVFPVGGAFFSSRRSSQPQADRAERLDLPATNGALDSGSPMDGRPHLTGLPPFEVAGSRDTMSPFPNYADNGNHGQLRPDARTPPVVEQSADAASAAGSRGASATVNDLEREMARLLGEITVKRTS